MLHFERDGSVQSLFIEQSLTEAIDKAECFIQTVLRKHHSTATASLNQIKSAAHALILQCVAGSTSTGGLVTMIGKSLRAH